MHQLKSGKGDGASLTFCGTATPLAIAFLYSAEHLAFLSIKGNKASRGMWNGKTFLAIAIPQIMEINSKFLKLALAFLPIPRNAECLIALLPQPNKESNFCELKSDLGPVQ